MLIDSRILNNALATLERPHKESDWLATFVLLPSFAGIRGSIDDP